MKSKILFASALILIAFTISASCGKDKPISIPEVYGIPDEPITDIDGNTYKTVKIGNQVWMAENLRTTKYRNGDAIPEVTSNSAWAGLNSGAYCNHNNTVDANHINTYGRLYNWFAVTDTRSIAPEGWHIPTEAEWATLVAILGGDNSAGGRIKEAGTSHWMSPNAGATNTSGFTALPSGNRDGNGGVFRNLGTDAYLWMTSTKPKVWFRYLTLNAASCVAGSDDYKQDGHSIRCIKD